MGPQASTLQLPELRPHLHGGRALEGAGEALREGERRGREEAAAQRRVPRLVDELKEEKGVGDKYSNYPHPQNIFGLFKA